jgi:heme/copper-type cytochrome/quinol oxidase subunit 3
MEKRSYKNLGRFILAFSIMFSTFMVFISFRNGNLGNENLFSTISFSLTCIVLILSGVSMKTKYPKYYRYQIIGATILLLTVLIIDVIPRVIYLI